METEITYASNLRKWHQDTLKSGEELSKEIRIRLDICEVLFAPQKDLQQWFGILQRIIADPNCHKLFESIDTFFKKYNTDLNLLFTEFSFMSFDLNQQDIYFSLIERLAIQTEQQSFSFLMAWYYLNSNRNQDCIDEIDTMPVVSSQCLAIKGQALLELGQVSRAIESLQQASQREPKDIMIWFQLAKACFCGNLFQQAWYAMRVCQRLAKQPNLEIDLFLAIIAAACPEETTWLNHSYLSLSRHLHKHPENEEVVTQLLTIAILAKKKECVEDMINSVNWNTIKHRFVHNSKLGFILKQLFQLWPKTNEALLAKLTQ